MPAPVAEIVVYGYVKGDVIYDLDGNYNKFSFSMPGQDRFDEDDDDFVFLHANQSRFGIKTKVDTAWARSAAGSRWTSTAPLRRRISVPPSRASGRPFARVCATPMANGT